MQLGATTDGRFHHTPTYEMRWGFETVLKNLDGIERFSYILWPYPNDVDFEDVDPNSIESYLQVAGSASRMSVELRESDPAGGYAQWVLGVAPATGEADQAIQWDQYTTWVHPEEVFDYEQAAPIFDHYAKTGKIPSQYSKRQLVLN